MALQPWRKGIVTRIENETYNTRRFWIKIPEIDSFDFAPGQFVTLDLPIHEKPNKRWRSYSIASWPDGTNVIELLIVLLDGGLGTTYLFNEVNEGSELILRGPQGVFTLPEKLTRTMYFICTEPVSHPSEAWCTTYNYTDASSKHQPYLVQVAKEDLLYLDEMKGWSRKSMALITYPLFQEKNGMAAAVMYMRFMKTWLPEKMNGNTEPPPSKFYLCGWKNMVDEARQRIQGLGYDKKAIHLELYG
jgi:ferredoxin-NADP reductase